MQDFNKFSTTDINNRLIFFRLKYMAVKTEKSEKK